MKILKNVFAGIGVLMILIATVLIIFFCGFAAGMDFKDKAEEWINKTFHEDEENDSRKFKNIEFSSANDAEMVLNGMDQIIEEYGVVTIADMEDLAGISANYTDCNYGWFDLKKARIAMTKHGNFRIKLPKPVLIDRRQKKAKYVNYVHYNG